MEHGIRVGRKRVERLMGAPGSPASGPGSGAGPRSGCRGSGPPMISSSGSSTGRAERSVGRRHHLSPHLGGLAVSRRHPGRVLPADRRLVDGQAHESRARDRRAEDGARRRRPDPGLIHHSDQGSQYVAWRSGRPPATQGSRSRWAPAETLGQRRRRDVLRDLEEGAHQPPVLADTARAAVRRVRVHRGVLQPRPPTLHPRHALPSRLRTTTTLAAGQLRSIARTTTINTTNPVSRKPGQVHRKADTAGSAWRFSSRRERPVLRAIACAAKESRDEPPR